MQCTLAKIANLSDSELGHFQGDNSAFHVHGAFGFKDNPHLLGIATLTSTTESCKTTTYGITSALAW